MEKKLSARERQAITTKFRVTDNALKLFREKGYESVKVTEICKAAEISLGTFYHYFESKDKIIDITYEQIDVLVEESIQEMPPVDSVEKIYAIASIAGVILENDIGWQFVAQAYRLVLAKHSTYSLSHFRSIYIYFKQSITEAVEKNVLKSDIDVDDIAELCMRTLRGVIFDWCLHDGRYSLKQRMFEDIKRVLAHVKA